MRLSVDRLSVAQYGLTCKDGPQLCSHIRRKVFRVPRETGFTIQYIFVIRNYTVYMTNTRFQFTMNALLQFYPVPGGASREADSALSQRKNFLASVSVHSTSTFRTGQSTCRCSNQRDLQRKHQPRLNMTSVYQTKGQSQCKNHNHHLNIPILRGCRYVL